MGMNHIAPGRPRPDVQKNRPDTLFQCVGQLHNAALSVHLVARKLQRLTACRRPQQWDSLPQERGDHANLDLVYESLFQKATE
jgi:hypothetical protein